MSTEVLDPKNPPRLTPPARSEGQYYTDRAADAKKAFKGALFAAKGDARQAVAVKPWLRKSPWITLGGAVAAGLAAGYLATPSKDRKLARRLATMERILDDEARARGVKVDDHKAAPTWLNWGLRLGMRQLKPIVISSLTGLLTGAAAGRAETEDEVDAATEPEPMADVT